MYSEKLKVSVHEISGGHKQCTDNGTSNSNSDAIHEDEISRAETHLVNFILTLSPVEAEIDDSEDFPSVLPPSSNSRSQVISSSMSKQSRDLKVSVASFCRYVHGHDVKGLKTS